MVTLFACGDVMPGRGIDQILPHPGDPELREDYASDADAYVRLAVRANGPIPRPAPALGDALPVIEDAAPDVRIINLETSVTRNADFAPATAGAGLDAAEAERPAAVPLPDGGRLLVFCCGTASSGIPPHWAATATRPGINLLPGLFPAAADALIARARAGRVPA